MIANRDRRRAFNNYFRETGCEVIYIFLILLLVLFNGRRRCSNISYVTIITTLIIKGTVFVLLKCTCCGLLYFKVLKLHWVKIMSLCMQALFILWQLWIIIDFFANNNKCWWQTPTLWFAELILVVEALFAFCKCGIFITLMAVVIGILIFGQQKEKKENRMKQLDFKKIVSSLG